jgi:hypothetical protein
VKSPFPLPGTHKKIEKRKEGKFTSTPVIASYLSILFFVIFLFGRLKKYQFTFNDDFFRHS